MNLLLFVFLVGSVVLSLLTAQSVTFVQAQQQQQQQPITPSNLAGPGTTLLTTFPNGTSKVSWVNGTTVQILNGVGYLVLDPSASVAASASASAPVSNTVVNRFYQAIAIAINIEQGQNDTLPILPLPNDTVDPIPEPPEEPEPDSSREISSEGCGSGFGYYIDDPNPICEPTDSIGEGPPPGQMFCAALGCPYNPPALESPTSPVAEDEPEPPEEETGNGVGNENGDNGDSNDDNQNGDDDGGDENEDSGGSNSNGNDGNGENDSDSGDESGGDE